MKLDRNFEKLLGPFENALRREATTGRALGYNHPLYAKCRAETGKHRRALREYVENIAVHRNLTSK